MNLQNLSRIWLVSSLTALMLLMAACGQTNGSNGSNDGNGTKQWSEAPEMMIDPNKTYQAQFQTNKGEFTIELYASEAPKTVNNFVFLANEGFYDGVIFHRIVESFMIQTGDPTGTGRGGPGYQFEDELDTGIAYEPGIVAMANAGKNTNGSQFFICTGPDSVALNSQPNYSIFGRVIEGMDTVAAIAATPVEKNPQSGEMSKPLAEVVIQKITIHES
ncbi:peptidylprolyl isomerase [Paenibacillus senegalensis]|uniref:peptidylprolyl isomerase n=1 Tax=Paenibacillus senegalensis TaxID=1465766 RepID=UPI0002898B5B|nr:peptidylprolyl isomerase [Paenibacillus senegalensis]